MRIPMGHGWDDRWTVHQEADGSFMATATVERDGKLVEVKSKVYQSTGEDYVWSATWEGETRKGVLEMAALRYVVDLAKSGPRDPVFNELIEKHNMWKAERAKFNALTGDAKIDYSIAMFADDPRTEPSLTEWRKTRQK